MHFRRAYNVTKTKTFPSKLFKICTPNKCMIEKFRQNMESKILTLSIGLEKIRNKIITKLGKILCEGSLQYAGMYA